VRQHLLHSGPCIICTQFFFVYCIGLAEAHTFEVNACEFLAGIRARKRGHPRPGWQPGDPPRMLVGGPPCQGFSNASSAEQEDKERKNILVRAPGLPEPLLLESGRQEGGTPHQPHMTAWFPATAVRQVPLFLEILSELRWPYAIMENVVGLLSSERQRARLRGRFQLEGGCAWQARPACPASPPKLAAQPAATLAGLCLASCLAAEGTMQRIMQAAVSMGYQLTFRVLNAGSYGTAQVGAAGENSAPLATALPGFHSGARSLCSTPSALCRIGMRAPVAAPAQSQPCLSHRRPAAPPPRHRVFRTPRPAHARLPKAHHRLQWRWRLQGGWLRLCHLLTQGGAPPCCQPCLACGLALPLRLCRRCLRG
jgi:hypothetical protein